LLDPTFLNTSSKSSSVLSDPGEPDKPASKEIGLMEDLSFVAAQYRLDLRSAFRLFDLIELGGERDAAQSVLGIHWSQLRSSVDD